MEKLNRAQKCSLLGPQNLGSRGAQAPRAPLGSAPDTCNRHIFKELHSTVQELSHTLTVESELEPQEPHSQQVAVV